MYTNYYYYVRVLAADRNFAGEYNNDDDDDNCALLHKIWRVFVI